LILTCERGGRAKSPDVEMVPMRITILAVAKKVKWPRCIEKKIAKEHWERLHLKQQLRYI